MRSIFSNYNQELPIAMEHPDANRGGIVTSHETRRQWVARLSAFLRHLKAAGYRTVHAIGVEAGKRSQSDHALSTKN
jgi:hypothetical protein